MKKIIALCVVTFCAGILLAQDVIALKNGERIEEVNVLGITDREISYSQNGTTVVVPRNSVEAILYADGRFETIKPSLVGDSAAIANVEQLGYNAEELQAMVNNGEDRKMLLWQDNSYPKECRKIGKKIYYKTFTPLYESAFKEAKKSGLKQMECVQKAMDAAFLPAMKASNEAVRECNGGM